MSNRAVAALTSILACTVGSAPVTAQKIYWLDSERHSIEQANLDGRFRRDILVARVTSPNGVTVDPLAEKIYWSDLATGAIQRANLDGTGVEIVVTGSPSWTQIPFALDTTNRRVYWSSFGVREILSANLNGGPLTAVLDGLGGDVRGIAVDPVGAKLYWTESGGDGAIRRANLDGGQVEDWLVGLSYWPLAIAIDLDAQKLYWSTTAPGPGILRANLDGSSVEGLVSSPYAPLGLALDTVAGKLYWTDSWLARIGVANLDGSGQQTLVNTGLSWPEGIAVHPASGRVFWAQVGEIESASLDGTDRRSFLRGALAQPRHVAFDSVHGKLYWVDVLTDQIQRIVPAGQSLETIVRLHRSTPRALALDLVGDRLYWSSLFRDSSRYSAQLSRANLDGTDVSVLRSDSALDPCAAWIGDVTIDPTDSAILFVDDVGCDDQLTRWQMGSSVFNSIVTSQGTITDVALDIENDVAYWAENASRSKMIARSDYDGTLVEPVITFDSTYPRSIALDLEDGKIYWVEGPEPYRIARSNLDGSGIEDLITEGLASPTSLALDLRWLGDGDRDRDVDLRDVALLQSCYTGSEGAIATPECNVFDFDPADQKIDLYDLAQFMVALHEQ